jgi:hypothetical protein
MADRVARHPLTRARRRAGGLIVLLGLLFAVAVPSVALAATTARATGDTTVAAATEATPAPAATPKPGETGTPDGGGWDPASADPFASLAPLMLGAVVLVILVVFIAMSFGESTEARSPGH